MTIKTQKQNEQKIEYAVAASIIVLCGLLGVAAWLANGDSLLWSVIETGLAWCF